MAIFKVGMAIIYHYGQQTKASDTIMYKQNSMFFPSSFQISDRITTIPTFKIVIFDSWSNLEGLKIISNWNKQ